MRSYTKGMDISILTCFMNAVTFEAEWQRQYEDDDINNGEFTNADGDLREVMMLNSAEDLYVKTKDYAGFIKPYKNNGYSFMAILPVKEGMSFLMGLLSRLDL